MTTALLWAVLAVGVPLPARQIQNRTLASGVRLVLEVDRAVPAVAVSVLVQIGDGWEGRDEQGAAHFLEHLAFRSSRRFGPGELRRRLMASGGEGLAATSRDWTQYLAVTPIEALPLAIEGLADATLAMRIDPDSVQAESKLLRQEYDQRQLRIAAAAEERMFALGFPHHGYGRTSEQAAAALEHFDPEALRRFHQRTYTGPRIVVAIVGDIDPAQTERQVAAAFEAAPITSSVLSDPALEPPDTRPLEQTLDAHSSSVRLGFVVPGLRHPDLPALDLLAEILGGGETGRLWRAVHVRKLATSCEATLISFERASLLELGGEALQREDLAPLEQLALEQVLELRREPVSEIELERARNSIERRRLFDLEDYGHRVQILAIATQAGDLGFALGMDRELAQVTPERLLEVARRYLVSDRLVTLRLRERSGKDSPKEARSAMEELRRQLPQGPPVDWEARRQPPEAALAPATLPHRAPEPVREEKLANGFKLVLLRDSSLPRVHATLLALAGSAYDPADRQGVAVLTNSLLRAGAASWDRDQIALRFAGLGGVYGFSTSRDFSSARITAATPELAPALELLAALWLSPQFPAEDFERERKALVERAQRRLDNPSAAADAEAYGRLYGDHPYSRDPLGEPRTLQQITRDDVIQFQRNHYRPASSVLALVGDFDPEEVLRWARGLFGAEAATGAELAPLGPLPPPRYGEILRRRQWTDAYLMFCTPVPSLNDPEFAALLTLQRLLALRNFDRLIYQRSLVYQHSTSLSSYQLDSELCVEAQLPVSNASTASREIRHQIEALQKGQFDVADFEAARRWALGSLSLERMSAAGRARSLATLALYGLPAALYSELPERLRAVKLEDARSAAAEFLNPDRWVTIRLEP